MAIKKPKLLKAAKLPKVKVAAPKSALGRAGRLGAGLGKMPKMQASLGAGIGGGRKKKRAI